jgi:hypothetical protein
MALAAATVLEIRTTGSDTNGGGFVTGAAGTDWSQQDAAQYSVTDGVTAGTTTITSATANFGTDVVGNLIYVAGGTGSVAAARYQITARTDASTITVDRSTGLTAGTGVTLKIGGALASPGMAGGTGLVSGGKVHQKAGTYTVTSASTNVTNGCVSLDLNFEWTGYQTTRNDNGTKPIIIADGVITTFTFFTVGSSGNAQINNLELNGNSRTSSRGIATAGAINDTVIHRCTGKNFTNRFILFSSRDSRAIGCYATGCSTASVIDSGILIGCVISGNTITGSTNPEAAINCIFANNTGASSDGVNVQQNGQAIVNCTCYGNGRHGVNIAANVVHETVINTLSYGNTGTGFNTYHARVTPSLYNCAAGGNGTDYDTDYATAAKVNCLSAIVDPFVNAAGGDFAITSDQGGSLYAAGLLGAFPTIATTGYQNIGAVQPEHPLLPEVQQVEDGIVYGYDDNQQTGELVASSPSASVF